MLTLHGELDISTQRLFASALAGVDDNVARIVIDFSDLTFIDCSNIGLIHDMRAGRRGTYLELRCPNRHMLRILELTGLVPGASSERVQHRIVLPLPSRAVQRVHVSRRTPVLRRAGSRVRAAVVLACLVVVVLGRGASAQQYPPPPIGALSSPIPSGQPHPAGQPTPLTPTPLVSVGVDPLQSPGVVGVDQLQTPGVTERIDTDGTSAVPGPEVLGTVVRNPNNGTGGDLPRTGLDVGVLVAWGLMLMLVGRSIVKSVRARQHRRHSEQEERDSRVELPFVDTSAFVGRYSQVGSHSPAN